jgi:[citrate (pro-3S)-lyase] ligase
LFGIEFRLTEKPSVAELAGIEKFLGRFGLSMEGVPDVSVFAEGPSGELVGTGSLKGNVIKMMAVDPDWQEAGLSGSIISRLVERGRASGLTHFFVFTKPDSADKFHGFGFREIARYEPFATLLEMGQPGIDHFRDYLRGSRVNMGAKSRAGAVVVNCNPFTKGHQYLVETGASRCDHLYVVVVETDLSSFPFRDRFALVREGTSHLENVTVIRSGEYAVSPATFPSYFLKGSSVKKIASIQARLDVTLFANLFVPALGISVRFVGTEPYCPVTGSYNEAMKEVLPPRGVELEEISRVTVGDGQVVSASIVREMIKADRWDVVREMVPESTLKYLESSDGKAVAELIKQSEGRH